LVVVKLPVMIKESKAKLWDSITYFVTTIANFSLSLFEVLFDKLRRGKSGAVNIRVQIILHFLSATNAEEPFVRN
jgi:hypothetical protein